MKREERARQFLPFSPLKGYEELIASQTLIRAPRRTLSEESVKELERCLRSLQKGDMVCVKYYQINGYVTLKGLVSNLDPLAGRLRIVRTEIPFADLWEIKRIP